MYRCNVRLLLVFVIVALCVPCVTSAADAPPEPPILMSPNNQSVAAPGSSLKLQVSSSGGPAPTAYRFVVRDRYGGLWSSPWISGAGYVSWNTPSLEQGEYWWTAQAMNRYGVGSWQQQQQRFFVRRPLVAPNPVSPGAGVVVASRNVSFSWTDGARGDSHRNSSRIYRLKVWNNGGWSYDSQWTIRGTTTQLTIPSGGSYSWQVAAYDGMSYSTFSQQRQFSVDSEPPKITISAPTALQWTNRNSLSWSVTDAIGQVTEVTLQWDGSPQQRVAATGQTTIPEGKRSVTIRAKDEAENASSAKGGPYWIDVTPPTVTINFVPTKSQRSGGSVQDGWIMTVYAEDSNGSGVDARYYSINGRESRYDAAPVVISDVGTYTCAARVVDKAGNTATASRALTIDKAPAPPAPPPQPVSKPVPNPTPQQQPRPHESRQRTTPVPAPVTQPPAAEQPAPPSHAQPPVEKPVEKTQTQPVEHP